MRPLTYVVGSTIDGYIADPDGGIGFFPMGQAFLAWLASAHGDELPSHIRTAMGVADDPPTTFDTVVIGRRTYEPALAAGVSGPYAHLRQFVVSRTLVSSDPDVRVWDADPITLARELKTETSDLDISLARGGVLASALLPEIDTIVVRVYPVVGGAFEPTEFALVDVQSLPTGHVVLTYDRS